eukprot:scaffold152924_cov30-Tisochrysis_lutea.AAC.1
MRQGSLADENVRQYCDRKRDEIGAILSTDPLMPLGGPSLFRCGVGASVLVGRPFSRGRFACSSGLHGGAYYVSPCYYVESFQTVGGSRVQ